MERPSRCKILSLILIDINSFSTFQHVIARSEHSKSFWFIKFSLNYLIKSTVAYLALCFSIWSVRYKKCEQWSSWKCNKLVQNNFWSHRSLVLFTCLLLHSVSSVLIETSLCVFVPPALVVSVVCAPLLISSMCPLSVHLSMRQCANLFLTY